MVIDPILYKKLYTEMEQKGYLTYGDLREKVGVYGKAVNTDCVKNNFDGLGLFVYDDRLKEYDPKTFKTKNILIVRPCTCIPWDLINQGRRRVNK